MSEPEVITSEQMEAMRRDSQKKLEAMQSGYWRLRNGKARYIRCPYCLRHNWPNGKAMCCALFAKAFQAILDRQDEVDRGLSMAADIQRMAHGDHVN